MKSYHRSHKNNNNKNKYFLKNQEEPAQISRLFLSHTSFFLMFFSTRKSISLFWLRAKPGWSVYFKLVFLKKLLNIYENIYFRL